MATDSCWSLYYKEHTQNSGRQNYHFKSLGDKRGTQWNAGVQVRTTAGVNTLQLGHGKSQVTITLFVFELPPRRLESHFHLK